MLFPLTFTVNATWTAASDYGSYGFGHADLFTDYVWWVPSRQMISNLSVDINTVAAISRNIEASALGESYKSWGLYHDPINTYNEYNRSLALNVQRNGPIIGFSPTMWEGNDDRNHWTINTGSDRNRVDAKLIRCYEDYDTAKTPFGQYYSHAIYTKCIRMGSGWSHKNKHASFIVPGYYNIKTDEQDPDIAVDIISSDRATFFAKNELPSWMPQKCFKNATASSSDCDWERFFDDGDVADVANRTRNIITTEMRMGNGSKYVTWAVDFNAFLGFTTYSIDASRITNPNWLVRTGELPLSGESISIDPNWLLAGWSVNSGGPLSTQRTSASLVQQVMSSIVRYQRMDPTLELRMKTHLLGFLPIAHAMSLIDHRLTTTPLPAWPNDKHPLLQRNARMYIWGYFLGSRTSIFAAVVAIGGIVVILFQGYFGFVDQRRYRGPVELLASALQHVPQGEFDDNLNDEKNIARMRFRAQDDEHRLMYMPS